LARQESGALRRGHTNILHEDRPNGVMGFDRTDVSGERIVTVVNAGRMYWAGGEYGVYVGSGSFQEILCSQVRGSRPSPAFPLFLFFL
jgi:hypothetical protein